MTIRDLTAQLAGQPPDALVAVAGQGRLAFVTHAHSEGGDLVVVLYVQEPEPVPVEDFTLSAEAVS